MNLAKEKRNSIGMVAPIPVDKNDVPNLYQEKNFFNSRENDCNLKVNVPSETSFSSIEYFDYNSLKYIYDHWDQIDIPNNGKDEWEIGNNVFVPKAIIGQYLQLSTVDSQRIGQVKVNYHYSHLHEEDHQGRQFAFKALSLQSFSKYIRHTITKDLYHDIDVINAHPSILVQYCQKHQIECPQLTYYVEHRDECFAELMKIHKNMDRLEAKKMILVTINGGSRFSSSKWFNDFKFEITQVVFPTICQLDENKELYEKLIQEEKINSPKENKSNVKGRLINHILCGIENDILVSSIEFLKSVELSVDHLVLSFDGFMIPKDVITPDQSFFTEMSHQVEEDTGYHVNYLCKDQNLILDLTLKKQVQPVNLTHINPQILKQFKKTIETLNGTKVLTQTVYDSESCINYLNQYLLFINNSNPPQLIEITDMSVDGYIIRKMCHCEAIFAPFFKFYEMWLYSPNRRTVKHLSYTPYLKNPPPEDEGLWNTFKGFMHQYDPNFVVDMRLIQDWLELIKHTWCCDDEIIYQYVISWFSHKLQKPERKIGVSIVCKSILQGVGKNTLFDMLINHVFGKKYGVEVTDNERLFNHFNAEFERSLLVLCDEIGGMGSMFKRADEFKSIITRNVFNVERKGVDVVQCPDRNDYLLFSNNDWIVKCEASDRRHLCLELCNDRKGDHAYWNKMYAQMNDTVGLHLFHYLANHDISLYNPREIPMTEWKRELKEKSMDCVTKMLIKFVNDRVDSCGIPTNSDLRFLIQEFETAYKEIDDKRKENFTSRALSIRLQKMLNIRTLTSAFKKGSMRGRGFELTILQLQDKIRLLLNDKEFKFGHTDENEINLDEVDYDVSSCRNSTKNSTCLI